MEFPSLRLGDIASLSNYDHEPLLDCTSLNYLDFITIIGALELFLSGRLFRRHAIHIVHQKTSWRWKEHSGKVVEFSGR